MPDISTPLNKKLTFLSLANIAPSQPELAENSQNFVSFSPNPALISQAKSGDTAQRHGWMHENTSFLQDDIHVNESIRSKVRQADIQLAAPDVQAVPILSSCTRWGGHSPDPHGYVQRLREGVALSIQAGTTPTHSSFTQWLTADQALELSALLRAQANALKAELHMGAGDAS